MFDLALETGSPASQLLQLKVCDLQGLNVGDEVAVLGKKPGQDGLTVIGPKTHETFRRYLEELNPDTQDFLFKSRKGDGPLSISSASRIVSRWFEEAGLKKMSGLLSLRKTWAVHYHLPSIKQKKASSFEKAEPGYAFEFIKNPTVQEMAYDALEHAIITARFKPGEKLVTEELARQMGISRIPIREALGRLEARNFITVQPKKGVTVNELSEKNFKEILKIRLMLELPAAREVALAPKENIIHLLENLTESYSKAHREHDTIGLLRANQEFHFTIYRETRMPILMSMIENLYKQVSPYYHVMFRQTLFKDPKTGPDYHQKIIDGMKNRNPDAVCRWLETDLTESAEFVIGVMRLMKTQ